MAIFSFEIATEMSSFGGGGFMLEMSHDVGLYNNNK